MKNGQIALVINTPSGKGARTDEGKIRAAAVMNRVTCITTLAAAIQTVIDELYLKERRRSVRLLELREERVRRWVTRLGRRGRPVPPS